MAHLVSKLTDRDRTAISLVAAPCIAVPQAARGEAWSRCGQRLPEGEAVQKLLEGIPDAIVGTYLDL